MRFRTLLILIAALLVIAGAAWVLSRETPYPIINEPPVGRTIIALGDSLTAGVGASAEESYPEQLARKLGVPIINAGVAGDTTADALRRLERDVLAHEPRIVIVCLGGNDLLRRVPREETMANLETIVRQVQERGALVILVGLRPIYGSSFASDIAALARRTGCPLVPDILGGIMSDPALMTDAIHPNSAGYVALAEKIEPVLEKYLATPARN